MKKRGFTLIELLVVVAIIGILAAIGITAVGDARVRARDARRLADISQIRSALESYFSEVGRYPNPGLENYDLQGKCLSAEANISDCPGSGTLFLIMPSGPKPAGGPCGSWPFANYYYTFLEGGNSYRIDFCLEKPTGGYSAGPLNASPAGIR